MNLVLLPEEAGEDFIAAIAPEPWTDIAGIKAHSLQELKFGR